MRYLPEPEHRHGTIAKTAILLINLAHRMLRQRRAVRRYLEQFLSDPRVIEIPRALWLPILPRLRAQFEAEEIGRSTPGSGPRRAPAEGAHREAGAIAAQPLRVAGPMPLTVDFAMRYGEPSIAGTLARLKSEGCERVLVLPMYPQYAASTTASALDQVAEFLRKTRNVPKSDW